VFTMCSVHSVYYVTGLYRVRGTQDCVLHNTRTCRLLGQDGILQRVDNLLYVGIHADLSGNWLCSLKKVNHGTTVRTAPWDGPSVTVFTTTPSVR